MNWSKEIDIYCERTSAALLSEPINLVTNIIFILVAVYAWQRLRRHHIAPNSWAIGLIGLCLSIGVGSALFHSFATLWAQMADVIPITIFLLTYMAYLAMQMFDRSRAFAAGAVGAFLLLSFVIAWIVPDAMVNKSDPYFGVVVALLICAYAALHEGIPFAGRFIFMAAVFTLALVFRSIDREVCDTFRHGTHFLWHCGTASTAGLALDLMVENQIRRRTL